MRIVPIITAVFVCLMTYLFIMQREALLAFAGNEPAAEELALATEAEKPPVSIVALKSVAVNVDSGVVLRGRTEAFRHVEVKAQTSGLVISQPLRKGTQVEKGQLLCELDPGTRSAELEEAKALLAEAEANNKVSASLVEKGFASETSAIGRVAVLEVAKVRVLRAEKELTYLQIHAPFSGLLESDTAEFGALLQPGAPCANVIALDPIKLVGFAPEDKISRLSNGSRAGARLVTGKEVAGVLTFLSRSADPLTRTFRVEVTVPNADLAIRDGSTADIFIALSGEKGHLLPQSALTLDGQGRLGVRTVEEGMANFYAVEIIRDTADGVWVSGLPESVDVIIVGQEYVTTGRRLTVTYKEDAS